MNYLFRNLWSALLLVLTLAALALSGCATTQVDAQNQSVRPWDAPQDWENGIPSSMTQGR